MKNLAIGIDLGATNFRAGVVDGSGRVVKRSMSEVGGRRGARDVAELLAGEVRSLIREYPQIAGAGVGMPGICSAEKGVVYASPHYPEWVDVDFKKLLSEMFGMPVVVDNDANMYAVGEGWTGAGRGVKNFLLLTLGTGIGGAMVCGGRLWRGDFGFAGEFGHMVVDFDGPACECGGKGCLEMFSSATGLGRLVSLESSAGKMASNAAPQELFEKAKKGDPFSLKIWKRFGAYLGAGVASLVNITGIVNVIIGGGITGAWDFFIGDVKDELSCRTYKKTASLVNIRKGELGDDAAVVGGAGSIIT